ncbi:MAG: type IV pilus biogenesis/stability protein PilW [Azospira oryzae]|nr:MAG: type IV pilus biogenesis/stability protein PilW [Azospira oryzae]PZP74554.1 MAG: type IV pilus biogenesis/stability protein PilW [Azospira oryzae]
MWSAGRAGDGPHPPPAAARPGGGSLKKAIFAGLVAVTLAGCAQPLSRVQHVPEQVQTPSRYRAEVHTQLGAGYYSRGQLGVALQELSAALEADSSYGPAYNVLGLVYAALGEPQLAEQNFARALSINPDDSEAHNNYGLFLCQRGREQEGIRHFLQAVRNPLYRTPEVAYVNAGDCARRVGDMQRAEEYFEKALRLQPAQPQALRAMAAIAYGKGRFDEAHTYLTRFMQVAQPDAESLALGVRIERQRGDREAEASYAAQLRNRFPQSKEARALESGNL